MKMKVRIALAFVSGFGFAAAAIQTVQAQANMPARIQPQQMPVIGVLTAVPMTTIPHLAIAFHRGLKETGYVEDWNVKIEYRAAHDQYNQLPALAEELVKRQVKVILAFGPPTARAAKAATQSIPIVFTSGGDVVRSGLVASLSRPGGNATGINLFTQAVEAKKLEQLNRLMPSAASIGFLVNPTNPAADGKAKEMQDSARDIGRQIHIVNARNESEIDVAFSKFAQLQVDSLVVGSDPIFNDSRRHQIVGLAGRYSMPAIYGQREYVADGGLISYGTSLTDAYRQAGVYAGSILNGEKPATLPVLQPTRFELVINLRTAKKLGITIPPTLLAIADEAIE